MYYEDNIEKKETPTRRKRGRPKKAEVAEEEKVEEELIHGYGANAELDLGICDDFKYIDQELIEKVEEEKVIEIKKVVDNREKTYKYHGTWIGPPGYLQLPGVGRIFPGREVELSEKLAQALGKSPNWRIRTSYEYKIDKRK